MKSNESSEAAFSDNIECQECIDKLLEYEDGLLSKPDASKLKKHLKECSRCQQYQHSLSEVWNHLGEAFPQELEPAPDFKLRFWKKVGQESDKGKIIDLEARLKAKNKYLHYWKVFTAAASLTVVGGAVLWSAFANNVATSPNSVSLMVSTNTAAVPRTNISVIYKDAAGIPITTDSITKYDIQAGAIDYELPYVSSANVQKIDPAQTAISVNISTYHHNYHLS